MFGRNLHRQLSDLDAVRGLQAKDSRIEREFFDQCHSYFTRRRTGIFDRQAYGAREVEDIFIDSWATLWQEIDSRKIYEHDGALWRVSRDGHCYRMTASLITFMMAIAKYKNNEDLRQMELTVYGDTPIADHAADDDDSEPSTFTRVITACVASLPSHCKEILTLFYYEGRSLDEIITLRGLSQTKDGLKTAKSKCMGRLKDHVREECQRQQIKIPAYA